MAICPHCREGIKWLDARSSPFEEYFYVSVEEGKLNVEYIQGPGLREIPDEFFCPSCGERLFDSLRKAKEFLLEEG